MRHESRRTNEDDGDGRISETSTLPPKVPASIIKKNYY